jgi:large subunit ribosomal protein L13
MPNYTIDLKGEYLGRAASKIAYLLQGKDSSSYEHRKVGDNTVVIKNAHLVKISGRKAKQKMYYRHSGKLGNLKKIKYGDAFRKNPEWVVRHAVNGMLPKNRLQAKRMRLLIFEKKNE